MGLRQKAILLTTCLSLFLGSTAALAAPNDHHRYSDHEDHGRPGHPRPHSDHPAYADRQHHQAWGRNDLHAHGGPGRDHGRFASRPGPPHRPHVYARGDRFPRGIHWRPVDRRFAAGLPHYRGYEWRQVGPDIILVGIATGVIYQVLQHGFD